MLVCVCYKNALIKMLDENKHTKNDITVHLNIYLCYHTFTR